MNKNEISILTRANKKKDDKKYKEGEINDTKNLAIENDKMESQETLNKILKCVEKTNEGIMELNSKFDNLDREVNKLKSVTLKNTLDINTIIKKMDDLEQYSRNNNIRVYGLQEKPNENTHDSILKIINDILKISNITSGDIEKSFRIGKANVEKPRAIFVKFKSHQNKVDVYGNKNKLKGTKITIREDLTKQRIQILNEKIEKYGKKNVWTLEGKIKWIENGTKYTANLNKQPVNDPGIETIK